MNTLCGLDKKTVALIFAQQIHRGAVRELIEAHWLADDHLRHLAPPIEMGAD